MAYTPATPYPKGRGDAIRSADWNEAVNELIRLENEKFNRTGGTVSGNLTVSGTISGTLANSIVGNNQLANNAVTNTRIADLSVTTNKIADLNVTSGKIADVSVTNDKLANGSVGTTKLDGYVVYNGAFTLAANASTTLGGSGEYLDSSPRIFHMIVFAHTTGAGYISWHQRYNTYDSGGRWLTYPIVYFTNHGSATVEIRTKVFQLRGPV